MQSQADRPAEAARPRLVDSHCHLNADRFERDADQVIGAARLAGVERILVPGWNVASSERALACVDRFGWLDAAVGIHPHDAGKVEMAGWGRIVAWAGEPRVVAIGETGLDYDRVFSPVPDQLANLRRNLVLALETGKPAILHCRSASGRRDAQDALVTELRAAGVGGSAWAAVFGDRPPAVIHSFSGPLDYAREVIDLGLAVSFSGLVFRAGEGASADAVAIVPSDRLLIETDSPFLAPPGAPRSRNEPEWVRVTGAWAAERRGVTPDAIGPDLVAAYDRTFPSSRRTS
ncbi:MAG: TatD family hydrolase [Chloroflexota bacterium]